MLSSVILELDQTFCYVHLNLGHLHVWSLVSASCCVSKYLLLLLLHSAIPIRRLFMQARKTSRKLHMVCKSFLLLLSFEQVLKSRRSTRQHMTSVTAISQDIKFTCM